MRYVPDQVIVEDLAAAVPNVSAITMTGTVDTATINGETTFITIQESGGDGIARRTEPPAPSTPSDEIIARVTASLVQKKVATTASVLGMADKIRLFVDKAAQVRAQEIASLRESIQARIEAITSDKERIGRIERSIREHTESINKYTRSLEELEKIPVPPGPDAQAVVDRLRKHKAIQYAKMDKEGNLELFFKPIWVDAQIEQYNAARSRMLVGCFRVLIAKGERLAVRVKNLTFPQLNHPHWSVNSSGQPCWGDWESTVQSLWKEGRLYDLVTILAAYLSSTNDGSAYSRTYLHRERRKGSIVIQNGTQISSRSDMHEGDIGVLIEPTEDNNGTPLDYLPAVCNIRGGSSIGMSFLVPVACNSHKWSKPNRGWWWDNYEFVVLTNEQKEAVREYLKATPSATLEDTRNFCRSLIFGGISAHVAREALLTYLDTNESVPYSMVAQPLIIDMKKINVCN